MALNYKKAGVDIDKGNKFVKIIKKLNKEKSKYTLFDIGLFGGFFDFNKLKIKNPVLVGSADGVGTKIIISTITGKFDTVGIDLVAMNVNDVICGGAKPIFFLDYYASGKLNLKNAASVMKGIVEGCRQSDCVLLGGETAEMPSLYKGNDYDLAGFCVGVVDKQKIIAGQTIESGDIIIGLASNGLHSNGFSLVRKVFTSNEIKLKFKEELIKPTKIYVRPILDLIKKIDVKGIAHITGGGFYDNIIRVVPSGLGVFIDSSSWDMPHIFNIMMQKANIPKKEMFRTFNMGIGMVVIVARKDAAKTMNILNTHHIQSWCIGGINKENGKVTVE